MQTDTVVNIISVDVVVIVVWGLRRAFYHELCKCQQTLPLGNPFLVSDYIPIVDDEGNYVNGVIKRMLATIKGSIRDC